MYFSKTDLTKAYWHIPLSEDSKHLTAFMTESHGLLQFMRLPIDLTDSGASLQKRLWKKNCTGYTEFFSISIDDILVGGKTGEEHDARVYTPCSND